MCQNMKNAQSRKVGCSPSRSKIGSPLVAQTEKQGARRSIHPCGSVKDEDVCLTPKKHFFPSARSWRARSRGERRRVSQRQPSRGRRSSRQSRWVVPRRENLRLVPLAAIRSSRVCNRTGAVCATKYSHCAQKCILDFPPPGRNHLSAEVSFVCASPEQSFRHPSESLSHTPGALFFSSGKRSDFWWSVFVLGYG